MSSEKVFAIIPARGGSKGVPKKNIRPLAGYPLIAYSIAAARLCSRIDRVIVSTDSEQIAELSRKYGAEVPFMRSPALAGNLSTDREFVIHALEWFGKNEAAVPDYLVHLRPTTPLRDPTLIDEAIAALMSDPEATSLRSGHECQNRHSSGLCGMSRAISMVLILTTRVQDMQIYLGKSFQRSTFRMDMLTCYEPLS